MARAQDTAHRKAVEAKAQSDLDDLGMFELLSNLAEIKLFVRDSKLEDGPRQRGLTFVGLAHEQGLFWLVISCYFNLMLFMIIHVIIICVYIYIISAALPWLVAA